MHGWSSSSNSSHWTKISSFRKKNTSNSIPVWAKLLWFAMNCWTSTRNQRDLRMLLAQTLYANANSNVISSPEFSRSFAPVSFMHQVNVYNKLIDSLSWSSKSSVGRIENVPPLEGASTKRLKLKTGFVEFQWFNVWPKPIYYHIFAVCPTQMNRIGI